MMGAWKAPRKRHAGLLQEEEHDDDIGAAEVDHAPKTKTRGLFRGVKNFLLMHRNKNKATARTKDSWGGARKSRSTGELKAAGGGFKATSTRVGLDRDAASTPAVLENVRDDRSRGTILTDDESKLDDSLLAVAAPAPSLTPSTKKRGFFRSMKKILKRRKNKKDKATTTRTKDTWGGFPKARSTGELKKTKSSDLSTRVGLDRGTVSTPTVLEKIKEEEDEEEEGEGDGQFEEQKVPEDEKQRADVFRTHMNTPSLLREHRGDLDRLRSSSSFPPIAKIPPKRPRRKIALPLIPPRTKRSWVAPLGFHITRMDLSLDLVGSYRCEYRSFDILFEIPPAPAGSSNKYSRDDGVLLSTIVHKIPKQQKHQSEMPDDDHQDDTTTQQEEQTDYETTATPTTVDAVCKSLELNRKLNDKTLGGACLGIKPGIDENGDTAIVLFYLSLAPIRPPEYDEFQLSVLKFLNVALELRTQLEPSYFWI